MDRWLVLIIVSLFALLPASASADVSGSLPPGFSKVTVATGIWDATAFAYTPDGRVIITERRGRVAIAHPGVSQATKTLIDLQGHVALAGDRGLLGVAVDPQFASNGYVYLLYTYTADPGDPPGPKTSRLTRIKVNADDTVANPMDPETVLLGSVGTAPCPAPDNGVDCIPSNSDSHSIGTVRAAADGTLWVGSGDGQNYNTTDPQALRTFNEQSMSGKILHVDRNGKGLTGHAFCPADNNLDHVCTKVFAKGFRNPFRFQLRGGTNPVVGDVGWENTEELDLTQSGGSYGWPCWEGPDHTPGYKEFDECKGRYSAGNDTGPAYSYSHTFPGGTGGAVVAGPQVTTTRYPAAWRNLWFVGDYVQGWLRAYDISNGQITNVRDFASSGFDGVDLEVTPEGDLAYLRFTDGTFNSARLERIVYGNSPPPAVAHATPSSGSAPLQVALGADESIDPDGDAVTYQWDFGDGSAVADGRNVNHTYSSKGAYTATLTVRDARGVASEDTVQVLVDAEPPVLTLQAPADGSLYHDGEPVTLKATATDADDGDLDADIAWHVLLRHGSHTHPGGDFTGPETTFTPPQDHDADSHFVITARVVDSDGLSDETSIEIHPETVPFTLASAPAGVALFYSGSDHVAPVTLTSAIGYHTSVSAPATITRAGEQWTFDRWSDGGARQHDITIPATASTLTATYEAPDDGGGNPPGGGGGAQPPTSTPGPQPETPRLKLDRAHRRARTLNGRITGIGAEPRVRIALRTARSHGVCRHWNARKHGLGRKVKRCATHVWMTATLSPVGADGWRWRVKLRGKLGRGRYVVVARVTDRRGRPLLSAKTLKLRVR